MPVSLDCYSTCIQEGDLNLGQGDERTPAYQSTAHRLTAIIDETVHHTDCNLST